MIMTMMEKVMRKTLTYCSFIVTAAVVLCLSSYCCAGELFNAWAADIPEALKVTVPQGWNEKEMAVDSPEFMPTEQQSEKGLVVFGYHFDSQIYPYSPAYAASAGQEIRAFAARNEYEPLCFAIHALQEMEDVSLEVGQLSTDDGKVLARENLDLRFVQMLYRVPNRLAVARKQYWRYPGVLVKRESMDFEEETTYPYVLHVYVPAGQPAGIYKGAVRILCNGEEIDTVSIKVRVLDIDLPRAEGDYGYWFGPRFPDQSAPAQMKDMYESGMNFLFNCHLYPHPKQTDNGYELVFDGMDRIVSLMRKAGMTGPVVIDARPLNGYASLYGMKKAGKEIPKRYDIYEIPVEDNKYTREAFIDMLQQIKQHADKAGWGKVVVYVQEEASNKAVRMKALDYFAPLVGQAGLEQALVSNATWAGCDEAEGKAGLFTYRNYNLIYDKVLASLKKQKEALWLYNMPIQRGMMGFYPHRVNARGVSQWAYNWRAVKNPFDPFGNKGRTMGWFYAYPVKSKILPTYRAIVFREGIDDIRYIQLLEKMCRQAMSGSDSKTRQQAVSAMDSLKARLDEFPVRTTDATEYVKKQSPQYFDTLRWQIAYSILRLKQKDAK